MRKNLELQVGADLVQHALRDRELDLVQDALRDRELDLVQDALRDRELDLVQHALRDRELDLVQHASLELRDRDAESAGQVSLQLIQCYLPF
jgi:hypothetical protein